MPRFVKHSYVLFNKTRLLFFFRPRGPSERIPSCGVEEGASRWHPAGRGTQDAKLDSRQEPFCIGTHCILLSRNFENEDPSCSHSSEPHISQTRRQMEKEASSSSSHGAPRWWHGSFWSRKRKSMYSWVTPRKALKNRRPRVTVRLIEKEQVGRENMMWTGRCTQEEMETRGLLGFSVPGLFNSPVNVFFLPLVCIRRASCVLNLKLSLRF